MGFFTASRLNKMKQNFRDGNLEKALVYADKINPSEIRTTYDLSMMADIYTMAERYGAARRVYGEMYKRNKTIRVCKQLIVLNIKMKNFKQAIQYVKDLNAMDSEDYERFIYQYQIGKAINQPDEYLIECLKKVREADYIAQWAMELAKLFYKVGSVSECVTECQNIKLWFPDTDYAAKADMLLRACNSGVTYAESVAVKIEEPVAEPITEEVAKTVLEEEYSEETGYAEAEFDASEYEETEPEYEETEYSDIEEAESDKDDVEELESEEYYEEESYEYEEEYESGEDAEEYFEDELGEEFVEELEEDFEEADEYYEEEFGGEELLEEEIEEDDFRSYDVRNFESEPSMTEISADEDVFFDISDSVKDIMADDTYEEPKENIATTLVNDSLTNDVISALLEQEKNGSTGDKDAVDESILRMIDEE